MNKYKNNKKIFYILLMIILYCIHSFAVVGNNDGSAFITKSEFDALKSSFQSQIDSYNANIDSKIDSAISSYLSGLTIVTKQDMTPPIANYNLIRWQNGPYWYNTKRTFTAAKTAGAYDDTKEWQKMVFKNFRNYQDGYWFSYDNIVDAYGAVTVPFMLYITSHDDTYMNSYNVNTSPGAPFFELTKMNGGYGWKAGEDIPFNREQQTKMILDTISHKYSSGTTFNPSNVIYSSVNTSKTITLKAGTSASDDLLCYLLDGIYYTDTTKGSNTKLYSNIKYKYTPFPYTLGLFEKKNAWSCAHVCTNLWYNGTDGGIGISSGTFPLDYRWEDSVNQYDKDMENLKYAMFGTKVTDEINFSPPRQNLTDIFFDLRNSGHTTSNLKVKMSRAYFHSTSGYAAASSQKWVGVSGELNDVAMTIPLWYRQTWNDTYNGNFKYGDTALKLGDGMPLAIKIPVDCTINISFKFREYSNATAVSVTPDNKIKIDIAKESFTSSTINYYEGYIGTSKTLSQIKQYEVTGPSTGDGEFSVKIPVKKGDDIWMRIDPLTTNGVYCTMSDLKIVREQSN